jgi:hypothetical protein
VSMAGLCLLTYLPLFPLTTILLQSAGVILPESQRTWPSSLLDAPSWGGAWVSWSISHSHSTFDTKDKAPKRGAETVGPTLHPTLLAL